MVTAIRTPDRDEEFDKFAGSEFERLGEAQAARRAEGRMPEVISPGAPFYRFDDVAPARRFLFPEYRVDGCRRLFAVRC